MRRQLQTGKAVGDEGYNGMLDCFKKIIKNEGYIFDAYVAMKMRG